MSTNWGIGNQKFVTNFNQILTLFSFERFSKIPFINIGMTSNFEKFSMAQLINFKTVMEP